MKAVKTIMVNEGPLQAWKSNSGFSELFLQT